MTGMTVSSLIDHQWVTVKDAAFLAGRSERAVYEWVQKDLIASTVIDGRTMVPPKAALRLGQKLQRGRPRGVPTRR